MIPNLPRFNTPQDVINFAQQHTDPAKVPNITANAQLSLSGANGGEWSVQVAAGKVTIAKGKLANPQLSMSMADSDFVALANREGNPMALFMQGKVKVQGDMALAMQLQQLLFSRS